MFQAKFLNENAVMLQILAQICNMDGVRNRKAGKLKQKQQQVDKQDTESEETAHEETNKPNNHQNNLSANTNNVNATNEEQTSSAPTANTRRQKFRINFEIDLLSILLFVGGIASRFYKLDEPKNIV